MANANEGFLVLPRWNLDRSLIRNRWTCRERIASRGVHLALALQRAEPVPGVPAQARVVESGGSPVFAF